VFPAGVPAYRPVGVSGNLKMGGTLQAALFSFVLRNLGILRFKIPEFSAIDPAQGKNLVLSSGVGSRQESRLPQIRYLVAAINR
jgi:hypothetical protein